MQSTELLKMLTDVAKKFRLDRSYYARNNHMHTISESPPQEVVDAVLTGFINSVGIRQGIDHALYAADLGQPDDSVDAPQPEPRSAKYIYHYYALYQPQPGQVAHMDGLVTRNRPLTSVEDYEQLRSDLAKEAESPGHVTICSLTLFSASITP